MRKLKSSANTNAEITLLCVIRDERLILESFLSHYRGLKVDKFAFIDNGSEDGSVDLLMNQEDCDIYDTSGESYANADFGVSWVRSILDKELRDKWCIVVDADEFIALEDGTLKDLARDMDEKNQNIVQTCLVEMFPSQLNSKGLNKEQQPDEHSPYYDNSENCFSYLAHDDSLCVKGGSRQRLFNLSEPAHLTKRSIFKYDFYKSHYLGVGMHWIFPHLLKTPPYDHTWQKENLHIWEGSNWKLRFKGELIIIKHFKFLRDNLLDFFKKRVSRNQDWDESGEYKKYCKNMPKETIGPITKKYLNDKQMYEDFNCESLRLIIQAKGKNDGIGAAYHSKLSAFAKARKNNYIYRNSPFQKISYPPVIRNGKRIAMTHSSEFDERANDFFGLKSDAYDITNKNCDISKTHYPNALMGCGCSDESLLSPKYLHSSEVISELRSMYLSNPKPPDCPTDYAIHIRRGDFNQYTYKNPDLLKMHTMKDLPDHESFFRDESGQIFKDMSKSDYRNRYVSNEDYLKLILFIKKDKPNATFTICSEGSIENFEILRLDNVSFFLDKDIFETMHYFFSAPNLVMSGESALSISMGIISNAKEKYIMADRPDHIFPKDWIQVNQKFFKTHEL